MSSYLLFRSFLQRYSCWFSFLTGFHSRQGYQGYQDITTSAHLTSQHSYRSGSNNINPSLPSSVHHSQQAQLHQPQQAASSATKELDELMASLSEFKVSVVYEQKQQFIIQTRCFIGEHSLLRESHGVKGDRCRLGAKITRSMFNFSVYSLL